MTPPLPERNAPGRDHVLLRLLATSDLHLALRGHDYVRDRPTPGAGLATLAPLIARLRAEAAACLLLDNGDLLQGGPMDALWAAGALAAPHPALAALETLGYDALCLGNHEFDHGIEPLERALAEARLPVLAGNLTAAGPGLRRWLLLRRALPGPGGDRRALTVGVTDFLPPALLDANAHHLRDRITAAPVLDSARAILPQMRAAGADVIVVLCHSGFARDDAPDPENIAGDLARLPGIDALIAGHSHRPFPLPEAETPPGADPVQGRVGGTPVVLPPPFGAGLGVIDLWLSPRPGGGWRTAGGTGRIARPDPADRAAPAVLRVTARAHAGTRAHGATPLGATRAALHSHFALLGHAPALSPVLDAQRSRARQLLTGRPEAGLPLLSAAAAFHHETPPRATDIPPGPLLRRHLADLCPFANRLALLRISGAGLRAWLERAASVLGRATPGGAAQPLLAAGAALYNLDVIDGLDYEIDLTRAPLYHPRGQPAAPGPGRIRGLRHAGAPVPAEAQFVLATNSYRIGGGGGYPGLADAPLLALSEEDTAEMLARHLADGAPLCPRNTPFWRFTPAGGAAFTLDTPPDAAAHAAGLGSLRLAPAGRHGDTRERFTLRL